VGENRRRSLDRGGTYVGGWRIIVRSGRALQDGAGAARAQHSGATIYAATKVRLSAIDHACDLGASSERARPAPLAVRWGSRQHVGRVDTHDTGCCVVAAGLYWTDSGDLLSNDEGRVPGTGTTLERDRLGSCNEPRMRAPSGSTVPAPVRNCDAGPSYQGDLQVTVPPARFFVDSTETVQQSTTRSPEGRVKPHEHSLDILIVILVLALLGFFSRRRW